MHVDFVPYVSGWTGKGMDTKVSLKQALKSLGFPGGSKRDTELNQWINHEKEVLAEVAKKHGTEWELLLQELRIKESLIKQVGIYTVMDDWLCMLTKLN